MTGGPGGIGPDEPGRWTVLLHDEDALWARASAPERAALFAAHADFDVAVRASGGAVVARAAFAAGHGSAWRCRGHRMVEVSPPDDGSLCGLYVVDAQDPDALVEALALLPEYAVGLRPTIRLPEHAAS